MVDLGIELPEGHSLVSYEERPDLVHAAQSFTASVWPEFMRQDETVQRYWHLLN